MLQIERRIPDSYLFDIGLVILIPFLFLLIRFYFSFVIWIAFVPAILLIYKKRFKPFLFYLLVYNFFISLLTTYFIHNFSQKYFFVAFIYFYIAYFIATLFIYFLYKKISYPAAIFVCPTVWFLFYNILNFIPGASSWFNIAAFQPMLYPLPWLLGESGVMFLILFVNSLIAFYVLYRERKILYLLIALIILLSACFSYSYFAVPTGTRIKVALVQGNFQKDWNWRIANANNEIFNTYSNLSKEAAKEKPDIIIWPEYAIPEDVFTNQELYNKVSQLAKDTNAYLVFGAVGKTDLTDPEYNYIKDVAYVFSKNGDYIGGYVSVIPFPFNEEVIPGTEFPLFKVGDSTFGISTCWEENFSFIDKIYLSKGADFIISLANNEPIYDPRQINLQAMQARLNAALIKRYIVRASNTGVTQVINPYGRVVAKLELRKSGFLIADIYIDK